MKRIKIEQVDQLIKTYCSEEWIYLLNNQATENTYKKGTTIFNEGDKVDHISIVKSGRVKVYTSYKKNTERIYRFATDGQIIGHRGYGKELVFPVTAHALSETVVMDIPISLFNSLLKANALFCYHFLMFFAEELRESEKHIIDMASMDIRQRIAQSLIINAEAFGYDENDPQKLAFTLSRKDISYLANTTYESVIRTLSQFQKEKVIELLNKEIRIIDFKQLRAIELKG